MTYKAFTMLMRDGELFMESFAKRWALDLGTKVEVKFTQPDPEGMLFHVTTYDPKDKEQILCDSDRFALPWTRGRWEHATTVLRWTHQWLEDKYGEKAETAT